MKYKKILGICLSIVFIVGFSFSNFSFAQNITPDDIDCDCACENYDGSKNVVVQPEHESLVNSEQSQQNISLKTQSANDVYNKLIALRNQFPDNKYWNHYVNNASQCTDNLGTWDETFKDSVTNYPCNSHNASYTVGGYDCNKFDGGIQCFGYANRLFYAVFGVKASTQSKIYGTNISVGDWVRCNNDTHSGIVLSISGNTFTMAEANVGVNCRILWASITYNKSSITYYKHASNYDSIISTPTNLSWNYDVVTPSLNNCYVHAIVTAPSSGSFTRAGLHVWNSSGTLVVDHTEVSSVNLNYMKIWYDIQSECGVTLQSNQTYTYEFFVMYNNQWYTGPKASFTTTEVTTAWQIGQLTPWDNNFYVYATISTSERVHFSGAGITIWDEKYNVVASKNESASYDLYYMNIFYNISDELGVTLKSGTNYTFQLYADFGGKRYSSPIYTVTTTGSVMSTAVVLDQKDTVLSTGEQKTLTATVLPENTSNKSLNWISNNNAVVKVNGNGVITAVSAGEATITVSAADNSANKDSVKITVIEPEIVADSIQLNRTSAILGMNENLTLSATIKPDNTTNKYVTWRSSDEKVAKVDDYGIVTPVGAGTANITASTNNGKRATCSVVVEDQGSENQLSVIGKLNRKSVEPGGKALVTVRLKNYDPDIRDIAALSIEIPAQMENVSIVPDSRKILLSNGEFSTIDDLFFVFMPDSGGTNIIPAGSEDLFSFQIEVSDQITQDMDIALPMKVTMGDSNDRTIMFNQTINIKVPVSVNAYPEGDIDCNHQLNIIDARLAKRIALKDAKVNYSIEGFNLGDLDKNGKITINEARKIKRVVLKETTF